MSNDLNWILYKKGKGNKIATQVVQIVYVLCALLIDNLQVPFSVLGLIFMHRWPTLCYVVYYKIISTMETIACL